MVITSRASRLLLLSQEDCDGRRENQGKEPQSYGSEKDWLTGKTGQTVNETPDKAEKHDEHFYHSHRENKEPRPDPAGPSPVEKAEENDPSPDQKGQDIPRKS